MLTLENIIEAVADEYGVTKLELLGRTREPSLDEARSVAALLARHASLVTWRKLGALLGGRHFMSAKGLVLTAMRRLRRSEALQVRVRKLSDKLELPGDVVTAVLESEEGEVEPVDVDEVARTTVYQRGEV